ncbi:MAG: hypothetical protein IRZ21_02980 [Thermoleophilaceae bacterium]|nr:hypothetical protein [Thermoleophilaceae bacterium]
MFSIASVRPSDRYSRHIVDGIRVHDYRVDAAAEPSQLRNKVVLRHGALLAGRVYAHIPEAQMRRALQVAEQASELRL